MSGKKHAQAPDSFVLVPLDTLQVINSAFLPANPRKMRSAAPETIEAVERVKRLLAEAMEATGADE